MKIFHRDGSRFENSSRWNRFMQINGLLAPLILVELPACQKINDFQKESSIFPVAA